MSDHVLDPSGDVVLTLLHPNNPSVPWNEALAPAPASATENPDSDSEDPDSSVPPGDSSNRDGEMEVEERPVKFRLSSRHLILASEVWRTALTGGWKESDRSGGMFEIHAEDWDPEAMAIVLKAVHGRFRQLPTTVTLEMLTKIALIVDFYAVHEAIHHQALAWVRHLDERYKRNRRWDRKYHTKRIYISWVLGDADDFKIVTRNAVRCARGNLSSLGLPIPSTVLEQISRRRRHLLGKFHCELIVVRDHLIQNRVISEWGCHEACRTMLLGAVVRAMDEMELLDYAPGTETHLGGLFCLDEVIDALELIRFPAMFQHGSCDQELSRALSRTFESAIKGLDLAEFAPRPIRAK